MTEHEERTEGYGCVALRNHARNQRTAVLVTPGTACSRTRARVPAFGDKPWCACALTFASLRYALTQAHTRLIVQRYGCCQCVVVYGIFQQGRHIGRIQSEREIRTAIKYHTTASVLCTLSFQNRLLIRAMKSPDVAERRGSKTKGMRQGALSAWRACEGFNGNKLCTVLSRGRADTTASFCALANEQVSTPSCRLTTQPRYQIGLQPCEVIQSGRSRKRRSISHPSEQIWQGA